MPPAHSIYVSRSTTVQSLTTAGKATTVAAAAKSTLQSLKQVVVVAVATDSTSTAPAVSNSSSQRSTSVSHTEKERDRVINA